MKLTLEFDTADFDNFGQDIRDMGDELRNQAWRFIKRNTEPLIAVASAGVGASVGATVVALSGLTAVGAVGGGAGIGAAAGPVGVVAGGLTGLAAYGVYRAVQGETNG